MVRWIPLASTEVLERSGAATVLSQAADRPSASVVLYRAYISLEEGDVLSDKMGNETQDV